MSCLSRKKRKNLSEDEKKMVQKVHQWTSEAVMRERVKDQVFNEGQNVSKNVSKICGVSVPTVYRCIRNIGPSNSEEKRGRPRIKLDEFDQNALSRLILGFYTRKPPELPTLNKIHCEALQLPGFPDMSRTSLFKYIKKLGFACKRRDGKMNVYQRLDVVAQRHVFLRKIISYRETGFKVFYQDETWCNANHTRQYIWRRENEDKDELLDHTKWKGGLNVPCGAGKRLIINHIGSEDGFLHDCRECFVGKKNSVDYHHEMNANHFERWWKEDVLPALPNNSVVVLDNARYHTRQTDESKVPTTAWRKAEIQEWLKSKGKNYEETDTKPVLLKISKEIFIVKTYELEKVTEEYCRCNNKVVKILRLPVGHSELNAIELIWAQVKNEVARKNVTFKITDVKALMEEALENVNAGNWKKAIKHTEKVEAAFREIDFGEDSAEGTVVDSFIIEVSNDDDSSSQSSDDSDEFFE